MVQEVPTSCDSVSSEIWAPYSSDCEGCLLDYDALGFVDICQHFGRTCHLHIQRKRKPSRWGSIFHLNVCTCLAGYKVSHPRRLQLSYMLFSRKIQELKFWELTGAKKKYMPIMLLLIAVRYFVDDCQWQKICTIFPHLCLWLSGSMILGLHYCSRAFWQTFNINEYFKLAIWHPG